MDVRKISKDIQTIIYKYLYGCVMNELINVTSLFKTEYDFKFYVYFNYKIKRCTVCKLMWDMEIELFSEDPLFACVNCEKKGDE